MQGEAKAAAADRNADAGAPDGAAFGVTGAAMTIRPQILRKRADFLRAAAARRQGTPGFLLQARRRDDSDAAIRVGFTCSKKIGNAVARNRAKRRLRALAQQILPILAQPGWDYVLVGRPGATIERDFAELKRDLERALPRIHAARSQGGRP